MDLLNNAAPEFDLLDENGQAHKLSDYKGKVVVLYFYPKDCTPGCTIEAHGFRDLAEEFEKVGAVVFGVSADNQKLHQKFIKEENLNFRLLVDEGAKVAMKYGVWVEKSMFGKKYMGIRRDTFVIDGNGVVVRHYEEVKPQGHAEEVLKDIKELA